MNFWVDLNDLGLGFHHRGRENNGEEERKRENVSEKMKENRAKTFYIKCWTGWVLTRSSAPRCRPLDLGLEGSGSILQTSFFYCLPLILFKFTVFTLQFSTVHQTHIVLFLSPFFLHIKPSKVFSCITSH